MVSPLVSSAPFVPTARAAQGSNQALEEGTPPGLEVDSVSLENVSAGELQTESTPGAEDKGSTGWVKAGMATMAAIAGVTAVAAMATPAQAQTSVGVYIGSDGWGVEIRDHDHHGHGRHGRHHDHGRHRGPWGGNHRGPWGGNHRGPWGGGGHHHDNHGPYYTSVGVDGRVHRFDRFGHVNDGSGHYRMWVDMWGNVRYDFNVHHH